MTSLTHKPTTQELALFAPDPWSPPAPGLVNLRSSGRPCLVVSSEVENVGAAGLPEGLPLVSAWHDEDGKSFRKYELPSTSGETDSGPASEPLRLSLDLINGRRIDVDVHLQDGLPRLSRSVSDGENDREADPWHVASNAASGLIDQHIDFINESYDEARTDGGDEWQGHVEGIAVLPYHAALKKWAETGQKDEPRKALIVRLEEDKDFRRRLKDVCVRPRRVLIRKRRPQNIARIQEVDPACLRWAARQPGITVAQKAGRRQELLGVVRLENADTPENRVVRDLLARAIRACARYVMENQTYGTDERVKKIRRFRRELRQLLTQSAINEVRPLVGVARPNYVLQHDLRYRPLWPIYEKLRKQQMQQDEVWRWHHRLWAEHCLLGISAALNELRDESGAEAADILIRSEQVTGKLLDARSVPPSVRLRDSTGPIAIDFVEGRQLCSHPMIPESLHRLSPDVVLVKRRPSKSEPSRILCVWALLDFGAANDRLSERCHAISRALESIPLSFPVYGLLIQPHCQSSGTECIMVPGNTNRCLALRVRIGLQDEIESVRAAVSSGLDLVRRP